MFQGMQLLSVDQDGIILGTGVKAYHPKFRVIALVFLARKGSDHD